MSRARLASTVPVIAVLAALFYSGKKKAEAVADEKPAGFDLKGFDGLGFHFKKPSMPSFKTIAKTAINPIAQLQAAKATFDQNKVARIAYGVATTVANPIKQIKTAKDFVSDARRGNDVISKYALIMSDPIAQQRAQKQPTTKNKHNQRDQATEVPAGATFPYEVEPGIWIDANGVRVNQDGSAYVDTSIAPVTGGPDSAQPPVYYGDDPATSDDSGMIPTSGDDTANDPNAPYYVAEWGVWYSPADDTYFDQRTNQLYDGYLNPISAGGVPGQESKYYGRSATDTGNDSGVPGVEYDPSTGFFYDYPTDTYYDPNTGQYYDGYLNPISSNDGALQGLGALGKFRFHVAPSAYAKTGAIVGAVAAVVGCVYASGGCAAYVSADAALAAYAWRKSKANPNDGQAELAAAQYKKEEADKQQYADEHSQDPYYDTQYNMWYNPRTNQYYDPTTQTYYDPSQPVTRNTDSNGLEPATY